jgi:hypothetical protein
MIGFKEPIGENGCGFFGSKDVVAFRPGCLGQSFPFFGVDATADVGVFAEVKGTCCRQQANIGRSDDTVIGNESNEHLVL